MCGGGGVGVGGLVCEGVDDGSAYGAANEVYSVACCY